MKDARLTQEEANKAVALGITLRTGCLYETKKFMNWLDHPMVAYYNGEKITPAQIRRLIARS